MELKDVIKLDFELWVKETKELVDTTKEDVAKDNDKHDTNNVYGPMPTIVGVEKLLPAMDKDLLSAKVGEERELEIPPQDAYGARDPKLMELCSMHEILKLPEFKKKEEFPDVGMEINLRGKNGIIVSMTSGRVRVDFNHPLAGKTLLYKYTVSEKAEKEDERASWIIQSNYAKSSDFKVKVKGSEAEITLPDVCKYDDSWFLSKYRVVSDLREVMGLDTIRFVEEYVKKAEKDGDNTVATTGDVKEESDSGANMEEAKEKGSKKEPKKDEGAAKKDTNVKEEKKSSMKETSDKKTSSKTSSKKTSSKTSSKKTSSGKSGSTKKSTPKE